MPEDHICFFNRGLSIFCSVPLRSHLHGLAKLNRYLCLKIKSVFSAPFRSSDVYVHIVLTEVYQYSAPFRSVATFTRQRRRHFYNIFLQRRAHRNLRLDSNACQVCEEAFPDSVALRDHFKENHPHLFCQSCDRMFYQIFHFRCQFS